MQDDHRRLAAILLTDIVGYTRMTQRDERLALSLLDEHNRLLPKHFEAHSGRVVKGTGDGFLVEFPSAFSAVQCAISIQTALYERNRDSAPKERFRIRVGIHLGDVVHREGDVFGDGVNITSRIEPLAPAGGIALSQQVYAQVWNKVDLPLESLGKRELKNIRMPVEVYRLVLPWDSDIREDSGTSDSSAPTPEKAPARIAVLPLANISPSAEDAYLADGMTEELIFTLSKIGGLRVIAKTSVMRYRESGQSLPEIGRELNVSTILDGSVRKAGSQVRITIQLIHVPTQEHLWSEAYSREIDDLFAVQTEIAHQVAEALRVHLLPVERTEIERAPTTNREAHTLYLRGRHAWNQWTEEGLVEAIDYLRRALVADPSYALAYAGLADTYSLMMYLGYLEPEKAHPLAQEAAGRALDLDESLAEAHASLAMIRVVFEGDIAAAEDSLQRAIELNPNLAVAHQWYALVLGATGRTAEAAEESRLALDLDPLASVFNAAVGQLIASEAERTP